MKQAKPLSLQFKPDSYDIEPETIGSSAKLVILGIKTGRPSHRITLHQRKLKVNEAEIIRKDSKGDIVYNVDRINHLDSFEEVRLHTKEILYPGRYEVILHYRLGPGVELSQTPSRQVLPSIDEPDTWAQAKLTIRP